MNGTDLGAFLGTVSILITLFIFGYLYNQWIEKIGNKIEGFVWLSVVFGVAVTQAFVGALDVILGWNAFFLGILAYCASGAWMVIGAIIRHIDDRDRARKAASDVVTEKMAE